MRIVLPTPRIGPLELNIRFALPTQELEPSTGAERVIPLVMPADATFGFLPKPYVAAALETALARAGVRLPRPSGPA